MSHIREALREVIDRQARGPIRWEVVRYGPRDPIPFAIRLSVLIRDDFRCKTCGYQNEAGDHLELDHCLPWSAGGPDDTDNLRVLCSPCNQRRSNWEDGAHRHRHLPTTWWCWECWQEPKPLRIWEDGTNLGAAPAVEEQLILAFCARCHMTAMTDIAFTANRRPPSAVFDGLRNRQEPTL